MNQTPPSAPIPTADEHRPIITIEGWAPEFGPSFESDDEQVVTDSVDIEVELPADAWCPVAPDPGTPTPSEVVFLDGVRRIEARVWITEADGTSRPGICASYAAGIVRCEQLATVTDVVVERGCFARAGVSDIRTSAGNFPARPVAEDDIPSLINGLQERMSQLEVRLASQVVKPALHANAPSVPPSQNPPNPPTNSPLLVIDGPLRGSQRIPGAVGYIKSHRTHYLPEASRQVVADLAPGQRTPLFLIQSTWSRFAWYIRLPGGEGHPWAGVVRCEAWPDIGLTNARKLASAMAATLPRYAAEAHKEGRAPQNLYPIAGLEREMKHRLGDPTFVQRALRSAVAE